uniref:RAS protein activator like 1 n=1 Tax=Laticauda laticaudata TaxID=8630 RepID=A0A8C5WZ48_LATLA
MVISHFFQCHCNFEWSLHISKVPAKEGKKLERRSCDRKSSPAKNVIRANGEAVSVSNTRMFPSCLPYRIRPVISSNNRFSQLLKMLTSGSSLSTDGWLILGKKITTVDFFSAFLLLICFFLSLIRSCLLALRDLAPRDLSGTSDPFARVLFNGQILETAIIKKTRFPRWEEMLEFVLEDGADSEMPLVVEVWDWDMVGKNDFLGQVKFCLGSVQKTILKDWFRLLPLPNAGEDAGDKLGQLRLQVRLTEDRILPSSYYQPLIDLLVESILCPPEADDLTPLALLEEVCLVESRQDVSIKLVKIFLGQGLVIPFLDYLNFREISRTMDPNTLFRSNSLASKSMEQFMKIVGMPYLHKVLKVIIHRIFEEKKYVELDPCKIEPSRAKWISFKASLSEAQIREGSLEVLKGYLGEIMDAIVSSTESCPSLMRVAFKQLYKRVEQRFKEAEHQEAKCIAISGFLFLRFFAPAILTPKLFSLRDHHADTQTSRTLLLLAKAVQSIGNLGLQLGHGKEQWMEPLHPFILASIGRVQEFLDRLIDVDTEMDLPNEKQPWTLFHSSAIIKEGYLQKRKAEGVHLVSRFTFKKRYFWLSHESFSYSKSPEWQVRTSIPIQRICAVERVDENAFQQPHVMQITTRETGGQLFTMYIQCKNVNELNQWLSAIRKATIANECMLPFCHPGAFRSNRWTCCLQTDQAVRGCSRTHSAVTLGDWSDPLDPDAEAQMVYKQLLLHKDKLRFVQGKRIGLILFGGGGWERRTGRIASEEEETDAPCLTTTTRTEIT